jgi:hypothetical protein
VQGENAIIAFQIFLSEISNFILFFSVTIYCRSRDSSVGIVTKLRDERFGFGVQTAARDFSLLENVQNVSGTHPNSYSVGKDILSRS